MTKRPDCDDEQPREPQGNMRGTRHLRVRLEIGDAGSRVESIWIVDQPVIQHEGLARDLVARIDVAGRMQLVEAFDDPRMHRGAYRKDIGHSWTRVPTGIVELSIPFVSVVDLAHLGVRIVDRKTAGLTASDVGTIAKWFDAHADVAKVGWQLGRAELQSAPAWAQVAGRLGLAKVTGRFEIYVDAAKRFRWRLRRPDGEIVADSGEGYATRDACEADLRWIRGNAASATIVSLDIEPPSRPEQE